MRYISEDRKAGNAHSAAREWVSDVSDVRIPVGPEVHLAMSTVHPVMPWRRDLVGADRYPIPHRLATKAVKALETGTVWYKLPESCWNAGPRGQLAAEASEKERIQRWIHERKRAVGYRKLRSKEALIKRGRLIYKRRCAACHG